ncbi:hypothetical protein VQH23_26525 (plasmid) [Pararoseomonas sp. SCSIO 73927]|uniref:hypothetical protein n=1 Tax=Pararoseomonas sp. SCSIO 73927 TaxID=3114537 RepID=UPI0030D53B2C
MPADFHRELQKRRAQPKPRPAGVHAILGLNIEEVSLVDDPANQGARFVLHKAKRPGPRSFNDHLAAQQQRPAPVQKAAAPATVSPGPLPIAGEGRLADFAAAMAQAARQGTPSASPPPPAARTPATAPAPVQQPQESALVRHARLMRAADDARMAAQSGRRRLA